LSLTSTSRILGVARALQKGNPNHYSAIQPKEAIANLKQQLAEGFDEKMKEADALVDMLTPLYDSAEKTGELEVAYIIRGQKNIVSRMRALAETARKDITVYISQPMVLRGLKESLLEARDKRRVRLNIALTQEIYEKGDCSRLGEIRLLCCARATSGR
jgi:sugar-specific transcriptional regulator TrmB